MPHCVVVYVLGAVSYVVVIIYWLIVVFTGRPNKSLYGIGPTVVLVIAWFAVIFTGRWPAGMRDFITKFSAYFLRVWAYIYMVDNKYPSFSLN